MMARTVSLLLVLVLGIAVYSAYRLLVAGIEVDVYRERLVELRRDHEHLRGQYNRAVRRTAVTELVVHDHTELQLLHADRRFGRVSAAERLGPVLEVSRPEDRVVQRADTAG